MPKKVFISYSHDDPDHKLWVRSLATRLRENSIDAVLDQFELVAGDDLMVFMENGVRDSDKVLLVCTPRYAEKANTRAGGAGYEGMVISAEVAKNILQRKFIPIVRVGGANCVPTFVESKLYVDLTNDDEFESSLDVLIRSIDDGPLAAKPPLGIRASGGIPAAHSLSARLVDARLTPLEIRVLGAMVKQYNKEGTLEMSRADIAYLASVSLAQLLVTAESLRKKSLLAFDSNSLGGGATLYLSPAGVVMAIEFGLEESAT